MYRASVILLLVLCGAAVGCETGTTTENVSTTGWQGQKVGQSSNRSGPVPGSTTGTEGNTQNPQPKPPQDAPPATQNLDSN
jgi:hypothetical protein